MPWQSTVYLILLLLAAYHLCNLQNNTQYNEIISVVQMIVKFSNIGAVKNMLIII